MIKQCLLTVAALMALGAGTASANEYLMRSGDQLNITVTQQPELGSNNTNGTQTPFIVRPDGNVDFPLVGEVHAAGMTVAQFRRTLQEGLSRYIVAPDVTVNITKLGTVRVYVFGEVHKPGAVELTKGHTVMDALGAAGSFTWDTGKKKIWLIHQDQPKNLIPIHLNEMLKTGNLSENYELREGDILYLTRNHRISFSRDIAPLITSAYYVDRIDTDN